MEVGPTGAQFGYSDPNDTRYARLFNGAEIVREAVKANSEYLVLWVRDGDFAYYNSETLPKPPGFENRDPLREAVTAARKFKLPLLAYCVVQQAGNYLKAHPEFEMRGMDGKPLGRFCFNSGYLGAMKKILKEQLDYGIDGFHIDMVDQGFGPPYGCFCDTCQRLFSERYGHPMPRSVSWDSNWDDFLSFRYKTSMNFERELYKYVKAVNPKATVDFNYHGNPPFSFEVGQLPVMHAANADFNTGETGQWGFSALGVALNAEFYRAATPGKPYQVAMQRGVRMYHDQTTRPLNDIRWELFTLLAHGAFVTMVDKTGFDGKRDAMAYKRIGKAFQEAKAKRTEFGQTPLNRVGIYFSSRSRDWMGKENSGQYFQSFEGAQKTCAYEHLPYGIILDESISLKALMKYPVVLLPNVGILSKNEVSLFTDYVNHGGNLVITGQSGMFNEIGKPLERSMLEDLVGTIVSRRLDSTDNWMQFVKLKKGDFSQTAIPSVQGNIPYNWPFLVKGPAVEYYLLRALWSQLLIPSRTTRQLKGLEGTDWPMSADQSVGPAILVNTLKKGRVVTFAGSPDYAVASDHHVTEVRKLFANVLRYLSSDFPVSIEAPANVEAVVTDDTTTRTLRIHFVAYNALPQSTPATNRPYILPGLSEDAPIFRVKIYSKKTLKGASAWSKSTVLNWSKTSAQATINDIHEVIRLKY